MGKIKKILKHCFFTSLFLFLYFCKFLNSQNYKDDVALINPYRDINWDQVKRYKANLHIHTKDGGDKELSEKVIHLYKERGYSILSFTEHNKYSSLKEGIYEKKIFLIKGIELGGEQHHHILGYFSFQIPEEIKPLKEEDFLKAICEKDGFAVFAHPGRNNKNIEWYVNFFKKYPNLIGIEVLNPSVQIKKVYGDTDIWDKILSRTMPERSVWGFGNDDFHKLPYISLNWNEILINSTIDEEKVKKAIKNGQFYICSAILGYDMPYIKRLIVDEKNGEIEIEAKNYKIIKWISNGKIVGEGKKINYKNNKDIEKYLRIEILGEKGFVYLNPFGIIRKKNE